MTPELRARFDAIVRELTKDLPDQARRSLHQIPVIIEDQPSPALLQELLRDGIIEDADDEILGLHTGRMLTEQEIQAPPEMPTQIHLFRTPIVDAAGGWDGTDADARVREEIKITLLHELGHHFGLDEDDLDQLGYS